MKEVYKKNYKNIFIFNWQFFYFFYKKRSIIGIDEVNNCSYSIFVSHNDELAKIVLDYINPYSLSLTIYSHSNLTTKTLEYIVIKSESMFGLNVNNQNIETYLKNILSENMYNPGIRIPGVFSVYESCVRSILGQQVSVNIANRLINEFINLSYSKGAKYLHFPSPQDIYKKIEIIANKLGITSTKKAALIEITYFLCKNTISSLNVDNLMAIKGVGAWTINSIKLSGLLDEDVWFANDLAINKICPFLDLHEVNNLQGKRSFLTLHIWDVFTQKQKLYTTNL